MGVGRDKWGTYGGCCGQISESGGTDTVCKLGTDDRRRGQVEVNEVHAGVDWG
jgi:hypothetical protein